MPSALDEARRTQPVDLSNWLTVKSAITVVIQCGVYCVHDIDIDIDIDIDARDCSTPPPVSGTALRGQLNSMSMSICA